MKLHASAPFDVEDAIERRRLAVAYLIYKADATVSYDAEGSARLVGTRGRAPAVLAVVPTAVALDAQSILHAFDPDYYPAPTTNAAPRPEPHPTMDSNTEELKAAARREARRRAEPGDTEKSIAAAAAGIFRHSKARMETATEEAIARKRATYRTI